MKGKRGKAEKGNSGYVQFFKYYYERLSAEHPRWNSTQITTIIKLLWKKRSKQTRKGEGKRKPGRTIEKTVSGWQFYRKLKEGEGHTRTAIKGMWNNLPIESKRYYKIQGQGRRTKARRTSGVFVRKILNSGAIRPESLTSDGIIQRSYGWMRNQMI